jgi:hypothetical protein
MGGGGSTIRLQTGASAWQGEGGFTSTIEGPMGDEADVIAHPKFRMWQRPDGIVQQVWVAGVTMEVEDARGAVEALIQLVGDRRVPLLVDVHDAGPTSRASRSEFVAQGDRVSATALLVGTPLSRMMGNFFLAVSKPVVPTRLFDDEASAVAWLLGFVG